MMVITNTITHALCIGLIHALIVEVVVIDLHRALKTLCVHT